MCSLDSSGQAAERTLRARRRRRLTPQKASTARATPAGLVPPSPHCAPIVQHAAPRARNRASGPVGAFLLPSAEGADAQVFLPAVKTRRRWLLTEFDREGPSAPLTRETKSSTREGSTFARRRSPTHITAAAGPSRAAGADARPGAEKLKSAYRPLVSASQHALHPTCGSLCHRKAVRGAPL